MIDESESKFERQVKLLQAIERSRAELNKGVDIRLVFSRICEGLAAQFGAEVSVLKVMVQCDSDPLLSCFGIDEGGAEDICRQLTGKLDAESVSVSSCRNEMAVSLDVAGSGQSDGFVFLGRNEKSWSELDRECLRLVSTAIGSVAIHARSLIELADEKRELEVIHRIHQLSDPATDEDTLMGGVLQLALDQLNSSFCAVLLKDQESNLTVRRLADRISFSSSELDHIRNALVDVESPLLVENLLPDRGVDFLVSPLSAGDVTVGALVLGRRNRFSAADQHLFESMIEQIDSAFSRSWLARHLEQRNRELEAVFRIDRIRDEIDDFDEMLNLVLSELCKVVSTDSGYILLYNPEDDDELELRASTRDSLGTEPGFLQAIKNHSRETLRTESMVNLNHLEGPVRSIIAVPLILNERVIGVFGAINSRHSAGFDESDARMLTAITSQVDTAVFERLERRRMRQVLSRSVDPKVLDALLQCADDRLFAGERVVLSVLFADIRGSTEWAEEIEPDEFVSSLNTYLSSMTEVIFRHGGTLDKFVGDEVIALFGSPAPIEDHAFKAAQTALEMQRVHQTLQREFDAKGKRLPPIGVGISSGEVIAGEFGPPNRTDFTAMGRVTNLGSRLCSAAAGNQVIISEATKEMLGGRIESRELAKISLKGIKAAVPIFELQG